MLLALSNLIWFILFENPLQFLQVKLLILLCINRLSCLALCFELIKKCASLYESLPSFHEIMHPVRILLAQHMQVNEYPEKMQVCVPQEWNNLYVCFINKKLTKNKYKHQCDFFFQGQVFAFCALQKSQWCFCWKNNEQRMFRKDIFSLCILSCPSNWRD